jgi:hypothetical protein
MHRTWPVPSQCRGASFPPFLKYFLHTMRWSAGLVDLLMFHEDATVP